MIQEHVNINQRSQGLGRWLVEAHGGGDYTVLEYVCTEVILTDSDLSEETVATARLIATAPELLEALKAAADDMDALQEDLDHWLAAAGGTGGFGEFHENIKKTRAAIAKAGGAT